MAPLGGFYQLILTDQQQDDAIQTLYRKNSWILHSHVLREQNVKDLLQNKDKHLVAFIQSYNPHINQEDKRLKKHVAIDAPKTRKRHLPKNLVDERKSVDDDSDGTISTEDGDGIISAGDSDDTISAGEDSYANLKEVASEPETKVSKSEEAIGLRQKNIDQIIDQCINNNAKILENTTPVPYTRQARKKLRSSNSSDATVNKEATDTSCHRSHESKSVPSVRPSQASFPIKVQNLYDQYVQVTNTFYTTISKMSRDAQLGSDSATVKAVNAVQSLAKNLHTSQTAVGRSRTTMPRPKTNKKWGLAAKKRAQSARLRSAKPQSAKPKTNTPQTDKPQIDKPQPVSPTAVPTATTVQTTVVNLNNLQDVHGRPLPPLTDKNSQVKLLVPVNPPVKPKPVNYDHGRFSVAPGVKTDFQCIHCFSYYADRRALRRHVLFKHPDKPPPRDCGVCKKEFATDEELRAHRKKERHNWVRKKQFQCNQCGDLVSRPETLKQHDMIPHTDKDKFPCDICGKVFDKAVKTNTHKRHAHNYNESSCDICGKTFDKLRGMLDHRERHNQANKKHMCDHCGKSFFNSGALTLHIRTHTGEKPYKCQYCDYASAWRANTQKHEKIHTKNTEDQMDSYITEQIDSYIALSDGSKGYVHPEQTRQHPQAQHPQVPHNLQHSQLPQHPQHPHNPQHSHSIQHPQNPQNPQHSQITQHPQY